MAQVPSVPLPSVQPNALDTTQATPDMFGAQIGQAVSNVGAQVEKGADVLARNTIRMQNLRNEADAKNAFVAGTIEMGQAEASYQALQGKDRADAYEGYVKTLTGIRDKYKNSLPNAMAAKMFDDEFSRRMAYSIVDGSRAAASANNDYIKATAAASADLAVNAPNQNTGDDSSDNAAFNSKLDGIKSAVDLMNPGLGDAYKQDQLQKITSVAWDKRLRDIALTDPDRAWRLYNANRDKINASTQTVLDAYITNARDTRGVATAADKILNGGAEAPGSVDFLQRRTTAGDPAAITKMAPVLRDRLTNLIKNVETAHPEWSGKIGIGSGYRTDEEQKAAYATARPGYAAKPGFSQHEVGKAADLTFIVNGKPVRLDAAPPEVIKAIHDAGPSAGIAFPLDKAKYGTNVTEEWHAEPIENRTWTGGLAPAQAAISKNVSFDPAFQHAQDAYDVPANLLKAIQFRENASGNPNEVSSKGAIGIMQIMPDTAKDLGVDPHDPSASIDGAARYVKQLLIKYNGDEQRAMAAYNWGPGNVDNWIKNGANPNDMPKETRDYVQRVSATYAQLNQGSPSNPRGTLQSNLDAASRYADWEAPGDATYKKRLQSQVEAGWSAKQKAYTDGQQALYEKVMPFAIVTADGKAPTTLTEMGYGKDPQVTAAYNAMDDTQRRKVGAQLLSNSKADLPESPQTWALYHQKLGEAQTDPDKFANEVIGDLPLPNARKKELIDLQFSGSSARKTLSALDINGPLLVAKPILDAAGIGPSSPANVNNYDQAKAVTYNQFVGALGDAIKNYVVQHKGAKPNDLEVRAMSSALIQQVVVGATTVPVYRPFPGPGPTSVERGGTTESFFAIGPQDAGKRIVVQVPPEEAATIRQQYAAKFSGALLTDQAVQDFYLQRLHSLTGR